MALAEQLIGTWRLLSQERLADGQVSYPMGRDARGYFTYDAHGRMSVQIMRADRPNVAAESLAGGTPDELRATVSGYLAYCAHYEVDEADGSVTHEIDVHLFPNAVGTRLVRHIAIDGDRLTITIGRPQPTARLLLERVT